MMSLTVLLVMQRKEEVNEIAKSQSFDLLEVWMVST